MALFKIRFVNSNGFVGRAIDWVTNSLFDHAEIETETGTWIGAHDDGGVMERPADYMQPPPTRDYRYSIPCTDEQYAKAMAFARSKIGTPYNFLDIAGMFIHDRKVDDPHAVICSQLVLMAAQAGGIYMLNVEAGYEYLISPETLHLSPLLRGHRTLAIE